MVKNFARCIAVSTALVIAPAAFAQAPAESAAPAAAAALREGAVLSSSDGKRLGRLERIVKGADGAPVSASVIVDSRFVYVPASTISPSEKGFSTTLTRAEVRKLK